MPARHLSHGISLQSQWVSVCDKEIQLCMIFSSLNWMHQLVCILLAMLLLFICASHENISASFTFFSSSFALASLVSTLVWSTMLSVDREGRQKAKNKRLAREIQPKDLPCLAVQSLHPSVWHMLWVQTHIRNQMREHTRGICPVCGPIFPHHNAQSRSIVMEAPYYHMFLSLAYCLKTRTHFKPSIKLVLLCVLLTHPPLTPFYIKSLIFNPPSSERNPNITVWQYFIISGSAWWRAANWVCLWNNCRGQQVIQCPGACWACALKS